MSKRLVLAFVTMTLCVSLSAQTFDWEPAGELINGRHEFTVQLLPDQRVLVMGGITGSSYYRDGAALNGNASALAELYNPKTQESAAAAPMNGPHAEAPSVITPEGDVIIVGGLAGEAERGVCTGAIERYDVDKDQWEIVGEMTTPRRRHSAVMIDDHRILIAGGALQSLQTVNTVEIFDLLTGTSEEVASMPQTLKEGQLVILDGLPTFIGGRQGGPNSPRQNGVISYIEARDLWVITGEDSKMPAISSGVILEDGSLVTSGGNVMESPAVFSSKVFQISGSKAEFVVDIDSGRTLHAMVSMGRLTAMVSGGIDETLKPLSSTQLVYAKGKETLLSPNHVRARAYHKLVTVDLPGEGRTIFAISGMQADTTLTTTVERLVIGSEQGLIASTTSVNEEQRNAVSVYPNPTTGLIHLSDLVSTTVVLHDAFGRHVSTMDVDLTSGLVDLSSLPNGLFLVQYRTTNGLQVQKVVKQ